MAEVILTDKAPLPIGPYSQAIKVGPFLYCSGQIPLDPKTGEIISAKIEGQTRQVMQNIEAVLKKANLNWDAVIKTTIYLQSMKDFKVVNSIYETYFASRPVEQYPALSTVEVSRLPRDVLLEIEIIAYQE